MQYTFLEVLLILFLYKIINLIKHLLHIYSIYLTCKKHYEFKY